MSHIQFAYSIVSICAHLYYLKVGTSRCVCARRAWLMVQH